MTETDLQRRHRLITELYSACEHAPQAVVCANCSHGPEYGNIAHGRADQGFGCVWPCRHEVYRNDARCVVCMPLSADELLAPF